MVWKCQNPACGFENEETEDYCAKCGLQKGSGATAGPPSTPSAPPQQGPADQLPAAPAAQVPPAAVQAPEAKLELVKASISLANEFPVTNGKTIGRSVENDIIVPDSYISRKHARISFENGVYTVEDSNSTNGTFLNDNDIKGKGKQPLKDGDEIRFGATTFKFRQA